MLYLLHLVWVVRRWGPVPVPVVSTQMKYVPIKFPKKVLFIGSICFIGLLLRFTSHSQSEHYPSGPGRIDWTVLIKENRKKQKIHNHILMAPQACYVIQRTNKIKQYLRFGLKQIWRKKSLDKKLCFMKYKTLKIPFGPRSMEL